MRKAALVLNGCGAKGAFQFMAEKYAREVKGYTWSFIAGVSVGALNGVMLAMEKYERLEELWKTISNEKVFTGRLTPWTFVKLFFGAKSIYGNDPIWRLIEQEVEPEKVKIPIRVGVVSLRTGDHMHFTARDEHFKKAILASTAVPILWPPVDISPSLAGMVDGAVKNISPLGDVLDVEPDEVVIISCNPPQPVKMDWPPRNVLDIGRRALEIASHEIFVTDYIEFIRINRNVKEAAAHGITLYNERGKPFKYYSFKLIEPDEPLNDAMDFSRKSIERSMEMGWEKARQILG